MVDSTYGVLFTHTFLPELFLGDFSQINDAFHVLAHQDCIRDLIYSGATDFQLHHPDFWRHTIYRLHSNEERLALRRVLRKHGLEYDEFNPELSLSRGEDRILSHDL